MADSLVLTGVKSVKKHTGDEMVLTRPKRGGDTHSVKEWWRNGVSAVYATCTIFDVTTAAGTVKLVLDTGLSTNVRIDHDGSFNFTFIRPNEIKRAALFTDAMELIEHYVFPAISGGKVMTVTPPGAASRPSGGTSISFTDTGNLSGTFEVGETITVTGANYTGGVGSVSSSYILQSSDDGNAPWTFVASSPTSPWTHEIAAGLDGKYLRESTQITDDEGLSSRNSNAVGPVTS